MVHQSPVLCMDFSLDSRLLASGDHEGFIKVWKVSDGKCLRQISVQLSQNIASITSIRINPANSRVFSACLDKSIKVFGLKSGTVLKELQSSQNEQGHQAYI